MVALLDEEVEAGDPVDLEGDRLLPWLQTVAPAPSPTASRLTCCPLATGKRAGEPVSCDVSAKRVPETASGSTSLTSTLSGVTESPMAISALATRTGTVFFSTTVVVLS